MSARKAVDLGDCPACRSKITGEVTFKVTLGDDGFTEREVQATVTATGLRVSHDCTPKQVRRVS